MFVSVSDFTGFYQLAKNEYNVTPIQNYIDEFERPALNDLLGAGLAQLLIDDAGGGSDPSDPELLEIFNELNFDDGCESWHSGGIKKYLLGVIFYNYVMMGRLKPSINGGLAKRKVESAELVDYRPEATTRYQASVKTSRAIQRYICINREKYPDYKGKRILFQS